jgi:putative transposase
VIELPRSTFYYRSTTLALSLPDARLVELIDDIQDEFPGYGYRRATLELRRRGHVVNHKRVARVMKAAGQGVKPRRRFVRTTDSDHNLPVFPNLYRNVIPTRPDIVWVGDITYIRIAAGFCYLAAILDACSRKVVGYAISRQIDTQLTLAALRSAVASRRPARDTCIHHTDRGSQPTFNRSSQQFPSWLGCSGLDQCRGRGLWACGRRRRRWSTRNALSTAAAGARSASSTCP